MRLSEVELLPENEISNFMRYRQFVFFDLSLITLTSHNPNNKIGFHDVFEKKKYIKSVLNIKKKKLLSFVHMPSS